MLSAGVPRVMEYSETILLSNAAPRISPSFQERHCKLVHGASIVPCVSNVESDKICIRLDVDVKRRPLPSKTIAPTRHFSSRGLRGGLARSSNESVLKSRMQQSFVYVARVDWVGWKLK